MDEITRKERSLVEAGAFSRTELLLGTAAMEKLATSRVAVFGIGGVGSYTVEALARAGVGGLSLIDDDCICLSNLNRQLHATTRTMGRIKVEVMRERVLEINPQASVTTIQKFYLPENAEGFFGEKYDYIVDAIDTVVAKIDLIVRAKARGIPVISCMGAGNKLDPSRFEVADIYQTSMCPLAKVMRYELRKLAVAELKVVYSKEKPSVLREQPEAGNNRRQIPGSVSFVPPVAGLILAGEVIKDLINWRNDGNV